MPKGWPTSLSSSRACNPASHLPKMPYYCGQSSGHSPSMWCLYGSVCYGLSTVFCRVFFPLECVMDPEQNYTLESQWTMF